MILVIGKNGQLAQAFRDHSGSQERKIIFFDHTEADLTKPESLKALVGEIKPSFIINCGAYTNVERAEKDISQSDLINHQGAQSLAEVCIQENVTLIHFSTDYVFSGSSSKAYSEQDNPEPLNQYGKSKLLGEKAVLNCANTQRLNGAIFRTSWLYYEKGHNFLNTMLKLSKEKENLQIVDDQIGTPTYCGNLATWVFSSLDYLKDRPIDLFHLGHLEQTSWYGFAEEIFRRTQSPIKIEPISTKDYPTQAKRPLFSVLDKTKFQQTFPHIALTHWKEGLEKCLLKLSL